MTRARMRDRLALATRRRGVRLSLLALAALAPIAGLAGAASYLSDRRDAADAASAETRTCQRLADDIRRLRAQQAGAPRRSAPRGDVSVATLVSGAAAKAGIADRQLTRIESVNGIAAGAGRQTRIEIARATMPQLVRLFHGLSVGPAGLTVRELRLSAADDAGGADAGAGADVGAVVGGAGASRANFWSAQATIVGPSEPTEGHEPIRSRE